MESKNTINNFKGITAFLNGEEGLHDIDQDVYDSFVKEGHVVKIFDNLFENPKPLENLQGISNLVLFTTGLRIEKIIPLVSLFQKSNYVPKNVIFLTEDTALIFLDIAKGLKNKGTKFWFIDYLNLKNIYSIEWI